MQRVKVCMDCEREERMKVEKAKVVSLERESEGYAGWVRREARSWLLRERSTGPHGSQTENPRAGAVNPMHIQCTRQRWRPRQHNRSM